VSIDEAKQSYRNGMVLFDDDD